MIKITITIHTCTISKEFLHCKQFRQHCRSKKKISRRFFTTTGFLHVVKEINKKKYVRIISNNSIAKSINVISYIDRYCLLQGIFLYDQQHQSILPSHRALFGKNIHVFMQNWCQFGRKIV